MARRPDLSGTELREPEAAPVVNKLELSVRTRARLRTVPWAALRSHPRQPKERHAPENVVHLRESIRAFGMFQPPLARRLPDGSFEILFGHRRATAAQLLVREGELDPKGRVWVVEGMTDFEALCVVTAEYFQQEDVKSEVAKAEWLGAIADEFEQVHGRAATMRELAHLVPPKKTSISDSLTIYRALRDPVLGSLVRSADKAGKDLLCKALGLADFRAKTDALQAFSTGGSGAMRSAIKLHRSRGRGRPASVVKRRTRAGGSYEVTFTVRDGMSAADADAILRTLDELRADVLSRADRTDGDARNTA